jgi:hypothetical protein
MRADGRNHRIEVHVLYPSGSMGDAVKSWRYDDSPTPGHARDEGVVEAFKFIAEVAKRSPKRAARYVIVDHREELWRMGP